jgi:hypothetical protein
MEDTDLKVLIQNLFRDSMSTATVQLEAAHKLLNARKRYEAAEKRVLYLAYDDGGKVVR